MTEKMGKIIFITGGVRSGKSKYAIKLAKNTTSEVIFLATGVARDEEMKKRIEEHKKSRPSRWRTIEETKNISSILLNIQHPCELVIIDCLTFFVSNLLLEGVNEETIQAIKPISTEFMKKAQKRLDNLTKPKDSLGKLEALVKERESVKVDCKTR